LYCGEEKPKSSCDFLRDFVDEATHLCAQGLDYAGQTYSVQICSFICDAPARSFILNTKGHTGYYGCGKCVQEGDYIGNRMVFLETDSELRTNESFRQQKQDEHHHGDTELARLPIDLVNQVPFEFMHLVCLGVVRKLLNIWVNGKCGPSRLTATLSHKLSSKLIFLRQFVPLEFARKPRSVTFLPRWKATEFRQFILYTGVIVLKDVLPPNYYKHFLAFHVGIYILCSQKFYRRLNSYAHELLVYFVSNFPKLYGVEQVSYNVH